MANLFEFLKTEWTDAETCVVRGYRKGKVVFERPATAAEAKAVAFKRPGKAAA